MLTTKGCSPRRRESRLGSPAAVTDFPFFFPDSVRDRCASPSSSSSDSFSRSKISRFPPTPRPGSPDVGTYDLERFPEISKLNGYNREICSRDGSSVDFSSSKSKTRGGSACFKSIGRTVLSEEYAVLPSPSARDRKSFNTTEFLDAISFKNSLKRPQTKPPTSINKSKGRSRSKVTPNELSLKQESVNCIGDHDGDNKNSNSNSNKKSLKLDRTVERLARLLTKEDIVSVRALPYY